MRRQGGKRERMFVVFGVVAAFVGLLCLSKFRARLSNFDSLFSDSKAHGRLGFGDLEGAFSGAMEPIGGFRLTAERREVLADDSVGGTPVSATVYLGGLPRPIFPDANGVFPPVDVRAHQRVQVRVSYPEGTAGEVVQIQTQDGGVLDEGASARIVALNGRGELSFCFEASSNDGTHRVTVRRGFDEKTFDFWVGSKPAMHVVRSPGGRAGE